MSDLTHEMSQQLETWAEQRDNILLSISNLRTENEKLTVVNGNLRISNSELDKKIIESNVRLEEISKKEQERKNLIPIEIVELEKKKTGLETSNNELSSENENLKNTKKDLVESINLLTDIHEKMFKRASVLDQVVDHVTRVNEKNIHDVNLMISNLKEFMAEIYDIKEKKNVDVILSNAMKILIDIRKKKQ